jgi:hypothetical protein
MINRMDLKVFDGGAHIAHLVGLRDGTTTSLLMLQLQYVATPERPFFEDLVALGFKWVPAGQEQEKWCPGAHSDRIGQIDFLMELREYLFDTTHYRLEVTQLWEEPARDPKHAELSVLEARVRRLQSELGREPAVAEEKGGDDVFVLFLNDDVQCIIRADHKLAESKVDDLQREWDGAESWTRDPPNPAKPELTSWRQPLGRHKMRLLRYGVYQK